MSRLGPRASAPGDSLPDNAPKNYWAVRDCFQAQGVPVVRIYHRNYSIGMHAHEFIELNIVLKGRGRHYMGGRAFPVSRGNVFVIPPDTGHGYAQEKSLDVYHLLLNPRFVERNLRDLRALPGFVLFFTVEPFFRTETEFRYGLRLDAAERNRIDWLIARLDEELERKDAGRDVAAESLALYLIARLCRAYARQHPAGAPREGNPPRMQAIQSALALVAERYGRRLSLNDLAGAAHMDRHYFCRLFREATGMTPMDYVAEVRVQKARELLRSTDLKVTDIAYRVGFYDSAHLTRTFRKLTGITPSEVRE